MNVLINHRHSFFKGGPNPRVAPPIFEEADSPSLEERKRAALARQGVDFHSRPDGVTELGLVIYLESLRPNQLRDEAGRR